MSQVRRVFSSLALPLCLAWGLGAACGYRMPVSPVFGYESDDLSCSDHADNDNDCLIDCEDPDCLVGSTICGELLPESDDDDLVEDPTIICATVVLEDGTTQRDCSAQLGICRDRVDNDLNGQFDCGDRKCQDVFETGCLREATNELCSDGIDNDQNGFPDCQDFGCLRSPLVDVCSQGELRIEDGDRNLLGDGESCASSVDTDNDGKIGCEDDCDRDCSPSIEDLEALGLVDDPDLDYEHCCTLLGVVDLGSCAHTVGCGLPENDAASCSDGLDNDNDGYFDCNDYDCSGSSDAAIAELCDDMESGVGECTDGVDNDGDGRVDCGDDECAQSTEQAIIVHCNGMETSVLQCSDMIDNDQDDYVDCADFDCSMSTDPAVQELCMGASGLQEPPVMGGAGAEDTLQTCSDMIDNDQNGFIDCEDFGCSMSMDQAILEYCASVAEDSVETCSDGIDNDGNGFTDCMDFSCSMSEDPAVLEVCADQLEGTPETCSDGIDNDDNGFIDCQDFGCSMSEDPAVLEVCADQLENSPQTCSDGIDNDDNGFIDCQDFGCSQSEDPAVLEVCAGQLENTPESCSDGIDNDGNGFTDCQDFGCTQADDFATVQVCQESLGLSNAETDQRCSDGLDNDNDGFADCDDFDCSHNAEVTVCPALGYCETGRTL